MELLNINITDSQQQPLEVQATPLGNGVFELTGPDGPLGDISFHQEETGEWEYIGEALDIDQQEQVAAHIQPLLK